MYVWQNLEKNNFKVDYIISHCAPSSIQWEMDSRFDNDGLTKYFDFIASETDFKMWFFGHYHRTELIKNKYMALFNAIVKLGE